jgi:hypothetical protein
MGTKTENRTCERSADRSQVLFSENRGLKCLILLSKIKSGVHHVSCNVLFKAGLAFQEFLKRGFADAEGIAELAGF